MKRSCPGSSQSSASSRRWCGHEIEWKAPSRCEDWTAGDVAAHVIGQLADVTSGRFDGLGTPEVTARQVDERRGRTPTELADELAQVSIVADAILGSFDEAGAVRAGRDRPCGVRAARARRDDQRLPLTRHRRRAQSVTALAG